MLFKPDRKIKLFCVPFAGGSAGAYTGWRKHLGEAIELRPLELAGRGKRIREAFPQSFDETVADLTEIILPEIRNGEYALFGHSMGSLLVYELYYRLLEKTKKKPVHIFFSGRDAPHVMDNDRIHTLPDREFIEHIKGLGGTPEDVFEKEELLKFFLPVIRADYRIFGTRVFAGGRDKLDCNISVLYGIDDRLIKGEITAWRDYAGRQCSFHAFGGGHFYLQNYVSAIVGIVKSALAKAIIYKREVNYDLSKSCGSPAG